MGWNGYGKVSGRTANRQTSGKSKWPLILSALLSLVVVVFGCVLLFHCHFKANDDRVQQDNQAELNSNTGLIAEVKPSISSNVVSESKSPEVSESNVNPVWAKAEGLDPHLFPYTDGRKVIKSNTNEWMVIDICIMPNGVRRKVRRNISKQLFHSATDQILLQAISTGNDELGPPIPFSEDMEEEFLQSLSKPIVINDDDTPEQRELKEMVQIARETVIDQINEGRTFFDAVSDHLAMQESNQFAREAAMSAVEELKENGDSHLIEEYLEDANTVLEKMGASPILPSDIEED